MNFLGCQVTDTGGIDDRSFNATAWKGMQDAQKDLGVQVKYLESTTQNDYAPNINAFLQQKCNMIITVGFLLGDATKAAARRTPIEKFAIVDFAYDPTDPERPRPDVRHRPGRVPRRIRRGRHDQDRQGRDLRRAEHPDGHDLHEGFAAGITVLQPAEQHGREAAGWNPAKQNGLFTGDFENQDNGRRVTEALLQQGADIILPVAGPVGLGAAAAVQAAGDDSHGLGRHGRVRERPAVLQPVHHEHREEHGRRRGGRP